MKCLFINPDFPPPMTGGSVVYYHYLHSQFARDELVVLTAWAEGSERFDAGQPYRILRCPYLTRTDVEQHPLVKAGNFVRLFFVAWRVIRRQHIDLIHVGHFYPHAFMGWLLSAITGKPFVLTVMGEDLTGLKQAGPVRRALTTRSLKQADMVITISSFGKTTLAAAGMPEGKIMVMTPGVDLGKCGPGIGTEPDFWKAIGDRKVILTVGRLTKRKGQDMVIRALPEVLRSVPDAHYLIVGDGVEADALARLAAERSLTDRVSIVPDATDGQVAFCYQHCRLFVMPNRQLGNGDTEGFGIVFLEAGYWGKPVIGGRAGGVPDAVEDGVTGYLVDGNDSAQIASSMIRILNDDALAQTMGRAGRRRAISANWIEKSRAYRAALAETCAKR